MTRRFRISLFIALAAAVGLHLRPCLGCLAADGGAPAERPAASTPFERPAITAMVGHALATGRDLAGSAAVR